MNYRIGLINFLLKIASVESCSPEFCSSLMLFLVVFQRVSVSRFEILNLSVLVDIVCLLLFYYENSGRPCMPIGD